jgi:nitrile hydratase
VIKEFGTELDPNIKIRVWDSTSELRYLVLPMQPVGTENWSEDQLSALVSRNSMIGVELAKNPEGAN